MGWYATLLHSLSSRAGNQATGEDHIASCARKAGCIRASRTCATRTEPHGLLLYLRKPARENRLLARHGVRSRKRSLLLPFSSVTAREPCTLLTSKTWTCPSPSRQGPQSRSRQSQLHSVWGEKVYKAAPLRRQTYHIPLLQELGQLEWRGEKTPAVFIAWISFRGCTLTRSINDRVIAVQL